MIRKNKAENISMEDTDNSWLGNNFHRLMIGVSVVWFTIVLIYISQFFGWSNLFLMMPDEFGGFLAGVTLPLAVIWMVMAYIDRGTSFKKEAKFLRAYMNQLVYPEEGGATTAKAMSEAIRSQVAELQEVTRLAMSQTEKIKQDLSGQVEDFASLVRVLDDYSTKSVVELTNGVRILTSSFDGVTDQAFKTTRDLNACMKEFSQTANLLQGDISGVIDSLIPSVREMKDSAEIIQTVAESSSQKLLEANKNLKDYTGLSQENFDMIIEKLQKQGQYLEDISEKAIVSGQNVGEKIQTITLDIDGLLKSQTQQVSDYADTLDENIREIYKKFVEHGDVLGDEVEKVISHSNMIEESISIQVNELKTAAKSINESLETAEINLSSYFETIENRSEVAVNLISKVLETAEVNLSSYFETIENRSEVAASSINKVIDVVEDKAEKMLALADMATDKAAIYSDNIIVQHKNLKDLGDDVFTRLDNLGEKFEQSLVDIKYSTKEALSEFDTLNQSISLQSDKLSESSSFAVAQSKLAESSIALQNSQISGSVSKIEESKIELKIQLDELSNAASTIAEEASLAVEKLKAQLQEAVTTSKAVVEQTGEINDNLAQETARFDEAANKTLEKVSHLEDVVAHQNNKLDSLVTSIDERATKIAQTLKTHTTMVDEATSNSGNTFNEILSAFEKQSTLLNSVAENTAGYVSEVVHTLDEKAENINLLFKHQQNEFFNVCNQISENTINIGNNLKEQISTIENNAEKVFTRMAELEQEADRRSSEVVDKSNLTIEKLSEIDSSIANCSQKLEANASNLSDKIAKVSSEFASTVNSFTDSLKEIKTNSDVTSVAILSNADKIKLANTGFNKDVEDFVGQVDLHINGVDEVIVKLREQSDAVCNNFNQHKENLSDVMNIVTAQTRLGEASIAKQCQYLHEISQEVAGKMQEISDGFNSNVNNIFDSSAKLSAEVNILGDRLLKAGEDIDKASQSSIQNIEQVGLALGQCANNLNSATDVTADKINTMMQEYEQYIGRFNAASVQASNGVVEVNDLISSQNEKMVYLTNDTKDLVDYFNNLLNSATEQLTEKANIAHGRVKLLGEDLKELGTQLELAANSSTQYFEKSGDKLRSTILEVVANAERISNEIENSSETFINQSSALTSAADDSLVKVDQIMNNLSTSLDEFNNRSGEIVTSTSNFNGVIQKQIELLDIGAKEVSKELLDMEKKYREVKVENFLKGATSIIERLDTLAIDINSIFNPEVQEKLWHKYYEGETDVFVRHLTKAMNRKQVVAIKNEFEKNPEFRKVVTSYISEFEELINKARGCEKSGILLSVISGADIGKIYYILARSLDKVS